MIAIGISLSGWLPDTKEEAPYANVLAHADFLIRSPKDAIKGDTQGGFYLALSSTADKFNTPADDQKFELGQFRVIDLTLALGNEDLESDASTILVTSLSWKNAIL